MTHHCVHLLVGNSVLLGYITFSCASPCSFIWSAQPQGPIERPRDSHSQQHSEYIKECLNRSVDEAGGKDAWNFENFTFLGVFGIRLKTNEFRFRFLLLPWRKDLQLDHHTQSHMSYTLPGQPVPFLLFFLAFLPVASVLRLCPPTLF